MMTAKMKKTFCKDCVLHCQPINLKVKTCEVLFLHVVLAILICSRLNIYTFNC